MWQSERRVALGQTRHRLNAVIFVAPSRWLSSISTSNLPPMMMCHNRTTSAPRRAPPLSSSTRAMCGAARIAPQSASRRTRRTRRRGMNIRTSRAASRRAPPTARPAARAANAPTVPRAGAAAASSSIASSCSELGPRARRCQVPEPAEVVSQSMRPPIGRRCEARERDSKSRDVRCAQAARSAVSTTLGRSAGRSLRAGSEQRREPRRPALLSLVASSAQAWRRQAWAASEQAWVGEGVRGAGRHATVAGRHPSTSAR